MELVNTDYIASKETVYSRMFTEWKYLRNKYDALSIKDENGELGEVLQKLEKLERSILFETPTTFDDLRLLFDLATRVSILNESLPDEHHSDIPVSRLIICAKDSIDRLNGDLI